MNEFIVFHTWIDDNVCTFTIRCYWNFCSAVTVNNCYNNNNSCKVVWSCCWDDSFSSTSKTITAVEELLLVISYFLYTEMTACHRLLMASVLNFANQLMGGWDVFLSSWCHLQYKRILLIHFDIKTLTNYNPSDTNQYVLKPGSRLYPNDYSSDHPYKIESNIQSLFFIKAASMDLWPW